LFRNQKKPSTSVPTRPWPAQSALNNNIGPDFRPPIYIETQYKPELTSKRARFAQEVAEIKVIFEKA
jgi:hypothetical protein